MLEPDVSASSLIFVYVMVSGFGKDGDAGLARLRFFIAFVPILAAYHRDLGEWCLIHAPISGQTCFSVREPINRPM